LERMPQLLTKFRRLLPPRAQSTLPALERSVRKSLNPGNAYNMVPTRNPQNGSLQSVLSRVTPKPVGYLSVSDQNTLLPQNRAGSAASRRTPDYGRRLGALFAPGRSLKWHTQLNLPECPVLE
jgi:hypothetical protein